MIARKELGHVMRWHCGSVRMQPGNAPAAAVIFHRGGVKMKLRKWVSASLAVLASGGLTLFAMMGMGQLGGTRAQAQSDANVRVPTIEEYQPKATLVTAKHKLERAKYPFVDIHSHHWNPTAEHVDELVKEMDTINLQVLVNLSGGTGESLKQTVAT